MCCGTCPQIKCDEKDKDKAAEQGHLSLDTHSEVKWPLLAGIRVVTVVEVQAVLAFLSPGADHHVKLVMGRRRSLRRVSQLWQGLGEVGTLEQGRYLH